MPLLSALDLELGELLLVALVRAECFIELLLQELALLLKLGQFGGCLRMLKLHLLVLSAQIVAQLAIGVRLQLQLRNQLLEVGVFEGFLVELGLHLLLFAGKLLKLHVAFQTQALVLHHLSLHLVELGLLGGAFLLQIAIDFLKAVYLLVKLLKLIRLTPVVRFELSDTLFSGVFGVLNLTVLDFDLFVFVGDFFVVGDLMLLGPVALEPIQLLAEAFPLFL